MSAVPNFDWDQFNRALDNDFAFYAPMHLFIKDKVTLDTHGFGFNPPQRILHARAEAQRRTRGYVRIIVVKARQQGISTYITGRGYWRSSRHPNTSVGILTHLDDATKNLFDMVRQFHNNCPMIQQPKSSTDSTTSLKFGELNSGYKIATARTKEAGRSGNLQFFHGSEVAFWPDIASIMGGVGQSILDAGISTEVYLESTGNGRNEFWNMVQRAMRGQTDYEVVFIPWFVSPEYKRPIPPGFEMDEQEYLYFETYYPEGLTIEHMAWRRWKTHQDFGEDFTWFDQEYPASLARAFARSSTDNPYIRPSLTEQARHRPDPPRQGPVRAGVDPSQGGDKNDRFAFVTRDDNAVLNKHQIKIKTDDTREAVGQILLHIESLPERDRPRALFVDRLNMGAGIVDMLATVATSRGHGRFKVIGVKASEEAVHKDRYANKRSEMWGDMRQWLLDGGKLINDDELESDLTMPGFEARGEQVLLEPKPKIAKRTSGVSPDFGDALAHTFYLPYMMVHEADQDRLRSGASRSVARNWKTL